MECWQIYSLSLKNTYLHLNKSAVDMKMQPLLQMDTLQIYIRREIHEIVDDLAGQVIFIFEKYDI